MKKRSWILAVCFSSLLLCACTAAEQKDESPAESSSEVILNEQELMEQNTEDIRDFALKQSDADQLVSEKLEGTGYAYTADGVRESGENCYYIYRVAKGEKELAQGLAVDDISGDVFTYDFESESLSGYDEFELYDDEKDRKAQWDGEYSMEENKISMLPADDASSEIHVSIDGKEVFGGMIYPDGNTAVIESENFTAELTLEADGLVVEDQKGKSGFNGNYVLE